MQEGPWDCLSPELLDIVKAMLECSMRKGYFWSRTMQSLRLVNQHWSSWATGAMTMLQPHRPNVPFGDVMELIAKTFVNLSSLHIGENEVDY